MISLWKFRLLEQAEEMKEAFLHQMISLLKSHVIAIKKISIILTCAGNRTLPRVRGPAHLCLLLVTTSSVRRRKKEEGGGYSSPTRTT